MKTYDFINANIGEIVYMPRAGDVKFEAVFCTKRKKYKNKFKLLRLTKSGMAYVEDEDGLRYSVTPSTLRLYSEQVEK